jgi:hypothetical protein
MSDAGIQLTQPDIIGYVPDLSLKGTRWVHQGNGYTYEIDGFAWNGEIDRWMFTHHRVDVLNGITYLRTPENFFGRRSNGKVRYVRAG